MMRVQENLEVAQGSLFSPNALPLNQLIVVFDASVGLNCSLTITLQCHFVTAPL